MQTTPKGSSRTARGACPGKTACPPPPSSRNSYAPTLKGSSRTARGASPDDMDFRDPRPEMPAQPAPPFQGGHLDLPLFPGLAPWAVLQDPFGVLSRCPFILPFLTASGIICSASCKLRVAARESCGSLLVTRTDKDDITITDANDPEGVEQDSPGRKPWENGVPSTSQLKKQLRSDPEGVEQDSPGGEP